MANILKLKMLVLTLLLVSSQLFSQTITLDSKKDTSICFSIGQGRFLLAQTIAVKELTEKTSLYEKVVANQKKEIEKQRAIIVRDSTDKKELLLLNKKSEEQTDLEKGKYEKEAKKSKELEKEVVKQKVYKWITIGISAVIVAYETYILVIKK
jgi:hypothetical protein